jgi:protein arginine N-methyltransferase 5
MRPSIDQLQQPLQPLHDHLASVSYEDFERDPVKYKRYEQAIAQALAERHAGSASVTVMVLGAGRGPIVDAAVRASREFDGVVRFFVIEKNPSAVVTLQHRARDDWADANVVIVQTDMRNWQTQERADIIVSELLGSWGDNELSPECLDGAQHLLKENGISIPASYTSWLAPITSAKLHTTVASRLPFGYPDLGMRTYFESTYVVNMGAVFLLDAEQPCFSFTHPSADLFNNERFAVCRFRLPQDLEHCTVHGFRGTFSCLLYGDHVISIADGDRSEGMFCWAPLYIPLERPFTARGGTALEVLLWRKAAPGKVWYEWLVKDFSHVHNVAGRSATIGSPENAGLSGARK